jgi:hypothetical protein
MNDFTFKDKYDVEWDLSLDLGVAKDIDASDFSNVTKIKFVFVAPERDFFGEIFSNKPFAAALAWAIVQRQAFKLLPRINAYRASQVSADPPPMGLPETPVRPVKLDELTSEELELWFIRGLSGSVLKEMHKVLMRSIGDFFPEVQTVLSKFEQKMDMVNQRLQMEMESAMEPLDTMLEEEMTKALKDLKEKTSKAFVMTGGSTSTTVSVG